MADIVQPFVAISGLAVGLTATTVITDSAAIPVAVSSFNGLTGDVTGVTTGTANTFVALQSFSSGISAAGGITFANDISVNNLTIGQGPVSGSSNTAIGEFALASLQTGSNNTAVGFYALASATAGTYNVAIGDSAMATTTNAGNNNVAIGTSALGNNAGGSDNIAIGNYALLDNLSGEYNVVIGHDALDGNQTGSRNTAIGYSSLSGGGNTANSDNLAIGYSALLSLNSGTQNTAIGTFAGRRRGSGGSGLLSATGGIYIGYDARASANTQTNEIVIGNLAVGLGSNTAVIGQNTQTSATIYGLVNAPSGISAAGATLGNNLRITSNSVIASSGFTFGATGARLVFPGLTGSLNGGYLWMQDGFFQIGGGSPGSGSGSFFYNPATERLYLFGYADFNHSYNYQAARSPLRLNVGPNHTAPILATYVQTAEGTQLGGGYSSTNMVAGIDNKGVLFSYAGLSASGATFAANCQAATYTETTNRIRVTNNARSWFL